MYQLPPAAPGMREDEIETPALVLDLDAFEFNLLTMSETLAATKAKLRPHAKTHKSAVIARLQAERGAIGQCVQKVAEAEAMAWGGVNDILVTNQIVDPRKLARFAALSHIAAMHVCIDSPLQVDLLETAARDSGKRLRALVEIDVGAGRCGVDPGPAAVELAKKIAMSRHLIFSGLQAYHGPAQHIQDAARRRATIDAAISDCQRAVELLHSAGLSCEIVSGAGTGTFRAEAQSGIYTEVQAGSYCFMDGDYATNKEESGEPISTFKHALFVLTTVISRTKSGLSIADAGHKAVAIERGLPTVWQRPDLAVTSAADEHLRVAYSDSRNAPEIGEMLRLVPRNCDPTVDRFDWYVGLRKGRVESVWPVHARGGMY